MNDGIQKDYYMGLAARLTFPRVDDLACRIFQLNWNCRLFKIDLSRYFRQIPLDPGDYSLIGYIIEGKIYFDKVLPMGMRSAPYIAQRITNAISHIHRQMEFFLLNYVDDFVGAEEKERVWEAFKFLTRLLEQLRVDTAPAKVVPPTNRLKFLGVLFDADNMRMEITPDRLQEIRTELSQWLLRTLSNKKGGGITAGETPICSKMHQGWESFSGKTNRLDQRNGQDWQILAHAGGKKRHSLVGQIHSRVQWGSNNVAHKGAST